MRLLPYGFAPGAFHMALDEVLLARRVPTLRLYGWSPPCVTLGYFQVVEWEVDVARCRALGIDVVRRATGGGAVLHEDELTYSVVLPEAWLGGQPSIEKSYEVLCQPLVDALQALGLPARFAPLNDILVHEKKISGNAQTRREGWVLQHGTILLDADVDRMFSVLKVPDEKLRGHVISNAKARVTSLRQEGLTLSPEALTAPLAAAFARILKDELHPASLAEEEAEEARRLAAAKYASPVWTARR